MPSKSFLLSVENGPFFIWTVVLAIFLLFILALFIKFRIEGLRMLKKNPQTKYYPYQPPTPSEEMKLETEILGTDNNFAEKLYILNCLNELNSKYPIRLAISKEEVLKMKDLFWGYYDVNNNIIRDLRGCTIQIMRLMGLTENKVVIKNYLNEKDFPQNDAAAFVNLPKDNMPLFGSVEFNKLVIPIHFKNSITSKFETFVYVMAHELAHIVLHSTKNPLKDSEIATDLFVMNRGFTEIMEKGRDLFQISNKLEHTNQKFGYLNDKNFEIAKKYIRQLNLRN